MNIIEEIHEDSTFTAEMTVYYKDGQSGRKRVVDLTGAVVTVTAGVFVNGAVAHSVNGVATITDAIKGKITVTFAEGALTGPSAETGEAALKPVQWLVQTRVELNGESQVVSEIQVAVKRAFTVA